MDPKDRLRCCCSCAVRGNARSGPASGAGCRAHLRHRWSQLSLRRFPTAFPRKGDEASAQACKTVAEVLRADLRFENLFQFVPDSLFQAIPAMNPDAPRFDDWKGIGATILVVTRAEVTSGELTVEAKAFFVDSGQVMLAKKYTGPRRQPASLRAPGVRRHHGPDPVPRGGPHQDRLLVRPRRDRGTPSEGALHRRLRRLQPAAGHGQRLAEHPSHLDPGRAVARLRLLSTREPADLPGLDLRRKEHRQPDRRAQGRSGSSLPR